MRQKVSTVTLGCGTRCDFIILDPQTKRLVYVQESTRYHKRLLMAYKKNGEGLSGAVPERQNITMKLQVRVIAK